ncbi:hypothetical protein M422DRAFT_68676 [Sphaerobolus stellatus SS14]|uniref:IPT/TIG domain-containing protein n=1 Tax=Sphaerobolus stellatus (strain SS14) TaxID=990650 RepID=A0A0C9VEQ7_SPHS4|nr:hypothetical protein M422DRAFT_68676 [Sphaerobolus stellatus SS14]
MASTLISMTAHDPQRASRSRSPSTTDSPSPGSASSDSPSSSDRDTHLSALPHWAQTPSIAGHKGHGMDVDGYNHVMDFDTEMAFGGSIVNGSDPYANYSMDEIVMSNTPDNTKQEMLLLEEFIRDGAYDPTPTNPMSTPQYITSPTSPEGYPQSIAPEVNHSPPRPPSASDIIPTAQPFVSQVPPNFVPSHLSTPEESQHSISMGEYFKSEPSSSQSPASWQGEQATVKTETVSSNSPLQLPFDQIPSVVVSSKVVYPPKEACLDLPIVFPSIPMAGTKSRVETQIKLAFQLAISVSDSAGYPSNSEASPSPSAEEGGSLTGSPSLMSRAVSPEGYDSSHLWPTHDRVGTYRYLRLPHGTTTKRRPPAGSNGKREAKLSDEDLQETLQMTADVVCCSSPHVAVQSCQSCQAREAKRTARKLAARVRPPPGSRKVKSKGGTKKASKRINEEDQESTLEDEDDPEEPNVDSSILQFNCAEVLGISSGSLTLPMRITCYCRHHKEKIGFSIVFTLTDYTGRMVARGSTPPILITDDHKSTNAVSKLPPMHPLRQTLHANSPPPVVPLPVPIGEPQQPIPIQPAEETARPPTKRREAPDLAKKRRSKPYDGRPVKTVGTGPGIEGRQGVVLALHPAHARMQEAKSQTSSTPTTRSPTPSIVMENKFAHASQSQSQEPQSQQTPEQVHSQPQVQMQQNGVQVISSPVSAHVGPESYQGTQMYSPLPARSTTVSPSSSSAPSYAPMPMESSLYSHLHYPLNNQIASTSSAPLYPSIAFPSAMPKIHRLIPSSGPITGGIEVTILGVNFHPNLPLECMFGGVVASSTHRWSENTLVCVLPPRAAPGLVAVEFKGIKSEGQDEVACLFNYVDESDRQLMELALQVVGLKMTGKIEEARNVAMRIVGTQSPSMTTGEVNQMNTLSETSMMHHQLLGSLSGVDLETLTIKLLTLLDVPMESARRSPDDTINHKNATGQTLLHLATLLALPSLVSCLAGRSIDMDACNNNGMTALHFAAMTGWREGVELLLDGGADPHIIDSMGLTPAERARNAGFAAVADLLDINDDALGEGESGEDGDDERWYSEAEESSGDVESERRSSDFTAPVYGVRSRMASSTHLHRDVQDESSETESHDEEHKPTATSSPEASLQLPKDSEKANAHLNEKQDTSFVERLQRTLPHGILPQMPGFFQMQLPDMPWGAFQNIPVFPVFVPLPNLPNLPNWPWIGDGEKKAANESGNGSGDKQQQPPLAMLWTAYDSIANNAWRAQWEKWTALQTNQNNAELPPYTPRSEEQQKGEPPQPETTATAPAPAPAPSSAPEEAGPSTHVEQPAPAPRHSVTRAAAAKVKRRLGYGSVRIPETEVEAYVYRPRRQKFYGKQDRMLVLFWLPILCLAVAYALYTALPIAFEGLSQAVRGFLPAPLQRI